MTTLLQLAATQPVVFVHAVSMMGATVLGAWLLLARKGRTAHRVGGWSWVLLMATAATTSVFMPSIFPIIGGFGPVHLLTLVVFVLLPLGVLLARSHRVKAHRGTMLGLYISACAVSGALTLMPGRLLGQMLWA